MEGKIPYSLVTLPLPGGKDYLFFIDPSPPMEGKIPYSLVNLPLPGGGTLRKHCVKDIGVGSSSSTKNLHSKNRFLFLRAIKLVPVCKVYIGISNPLLQANSSLPSQCSELVHVQ